MGFINLQYFFYFGETVFMVDFSIGLIIKSNKRLPTKDMINQINTN